MSDWDDHGYGGGMSGGIASRHAPICSEPYCYNAKPCKVHDKLTPPATQAPLDPASSPEDEHGYRVKCPRCGLFQARFEVYALEQRAWDEAEPALAEGQQSSTLVEKGVEKEKAATQAAEPPAGER